MTITSIKTLKTPFKLSNGLLAAKAQNIIGA
jgi:hypothetical protein